MERKSYITRFDVEIGVLCGNIHKIFIQNLNLLPIVYYLLTLDFRIVTLVEQNYRTLKCATQQGLNRIPGAGTKKKYQIIILVAFAN